MIHPINKTEAIALRVVSYSNTSHIVTWLTPEYGKLVTIVKGACRPKRAAAGEYDLGWRCELLFYAHDRNGLHIFKECAALDRRSVCRGDWRRTAALGYVCHLAGTVSPDGAHAPDLYRLAENVLNWITESAVPHDTLMLWFELQLLQLLGLAPRMDQCIRCRQRLDPDEEVRFPVAAGGAVCARCRVDTNHPLTTLLLQGELRNLLIRWQRSTSFAPLCRLPLDPGVREQLCRSMGPFLTHHLESAPECRQVAYQMIGMQLQPVPAHQGLKAGIHRDYKPGAQKTLDAGEVDA